MNGYRAIRKSNPLASDLHVDTPLSNILINYMQTQSNFVANKVFPVVPVDKQSDKYYKFNKGDLNRRQMAVQGSEDYARTMGFRASNESYYADYYSGRLPLARRTAKNSDIDLVKPYINFIGRQGLLEREALWINAGFTTSVWGTEWDGVASGPTGTEFLQFNKSGSVPITVIDSLIDTVRILGGGFRPNKMVIGPDVWQTLKNHSTLIARIQYQGATPNIITEQILAELFRMDEVHIADSVYNSAGENLTPTMANQAGKHVWVGYVTNNPSMEEPSAGYCFSWDEFDQGDGAVIRRYEDPALGGGSEWFEGNISCDFKVTGSDLGGLLNGAIS